MSKLLTKEEVSNLVNRIEPRQMKNIDFIYEIYNDAFEGVGEMKNELSPTFEVNSIDLIFYLLGEMVYSTSPLKDEDLDKFKSNKVYKESMTSVVADKYLSLSLYNHREQKLTNEYLPPISSLELYLNLMSNIVSRYKRNNPRSTLIVDLLTKSLSIARCTLKLLCEGYETEALSMWRTLHECESILIVLDKYQDIAINAYLKHMEYGIVYKDGLPDKERQNALFVQIKKEMAEHELKSKDMKKFIEYGWLYAIEDYKNIPEFKLNFRDGLEKMAGLHKYSGIYMTSSEILHSTPLLIYSNKAYFYYLTLLNLYESFFRIEVVFQSLFFSLVDKEGKTRYLEMRKLYHSQLVSIHRREIIMFENMKKGTTK